MTERYRARRAAGVCTRCGGRRDRPASFICSHCELDRRAEAERRYERDPVKARSAHLETNYGVTLAEKEARLASQGGVCAICGAKEPGGQRNVWHFDHDHRLDSRDPRSHRGVLCSACNAGLGRFKDDPALLRAAASYIESHLR